MLKLKLDNLMDKSSPSFHFIRVINKKALILNLTMRRHA